VRRSVLHLAVAVTASVVGGLLSPAVAAAAPPAAPPPGITQGCGGTSWWAGTTTVCDGTVVYRDYVNDDHGADTGGIGYNGTQSAFGTLAHPAGDRRYAADRISVADLVRLELSRRGNQVEVVAETAALYRPDDAVLVLALDTDGGPATGGGTWGGSASAATGGTPWSSSTPATRPATRCAARSRCRLRPGGGCRR
jgi:hypothetical protein